MLPTATSCNSPGSEPRCLWPPPVFSILAGFSHLSFNLNSFNQCYFNVVLCCFHFFSVFCQFCSKHVPQIPNHNFPWNNPSPEGRTTSLGLTPKALALATVVGLKKHSILNPGLTSWFSQPHYFKALEVVPWIWQVNKNQWTHHSAHLGLISMLERRDSPESTETYRDNSVNHRHVLVSPHECT